MGELGRRRVLIIDDDLGFASALRRLLGRDFTVAHEVHAIDCLVRLEAGERFDVIVCDVELPGLLGPDLWHCVQRLSPEQAARFVFVTGAAQRDVAELFEDVVAPCFAKPLSAAAIQCVVEGCGAAARVRPRNPLAGTGWG